MKKGFTLIELLVVIAVLAVLAAGIFVALDPIDKINAANDAKVQSDIGQIAQAMEAYATVQTGTYATSQEQLVTNGDLKMTFVPPGGGAYSLSAGSGTPLSQKTWGSLKSKRYTSAGYSVWMWCSSTGKAGSVNATGNCP
ncbi:MAG: type II secretion system protein [Candidatus Gottesmanbacteria bacterium]